MREIVTDCDSYLSEIVPLNRHIPTEADIFGPQSRLVNGEIVLPQPIDQLSWIDNYGYEGLIIAIFILFCYLIYNFRGDILQLFRFLTMGISSEKIFTEQNLFFKRFINLSTLLAALLTSGLAVRLAGYFGIDRLLPPEVGLLNVNLIPIVLLLPAAIVILYRYLAVKLVAAVTQNYTFFRSYRFMSHLFGTLSSLVLTPFFLIFALGEDLRSGFFIYLTISIAALFYLLYLGKSYYFFVERNVSILQWILYLCTIELFPVSFLLLGAMRLG